jgi:hypothetical protein
VITLNVTTNPIETRQNHMNLEGAKEVFENPNSVHNDSLLLAEWSICFSNVTHTVHRRASEELLELKLEAGAEKFEA